MSDVSDIATKNSIVENEQLKQEIAQLKTQLDATSKALMKSQEVIDSMERAKIIPIVKSNFNYTDAQIAQMDTAELYSKVELARTLKKPIIGLNPALDTDDPTSVLTVPKKFAFGGK